jgi:hypothetical protein
MKLTENRTKIVLAFLAVIAAAIGTAWSWTTIVNSTTGSHSPIINGNSAPVIIGK